MKLTIYKYVFDTDCGTGCRVYADEQSAAKDMLHDIQSDGHTVPLVTESSLTCEIVNSIWQEISEALRHNLDTRFLESDELDIPAKA